MNKLSRQIFGFLVFYVLIFSTGCDQFFPKPVPDCEFSESGSLNFGGEMKLFWDESDPSKIPNGFLSDYDPFATGNNWISSLMQIVNKYPPANCQNCEKEGYILATVYGHPDFCNGNHTEEYSLSEGNSDVISFTSITDVPFPHIFAPSSVKVEIYSPKYEGVQSYWQVMLLDGKTYLSTGENQLKGNWIGKIFKGDGTQIKIYVSNMFNLYTVTQ